MAQLHVTRVRREFREIVTSEEVRRGGRREGEGGGEEGGRWRLEGGEEGAVTPVDPRVVATNFKSTA